MPSHARYHRDDEEGSSSEEESEEYASGSEEEPGSYEEEEDGSYSGSYVDDGKDHSSQTSDYSKSEESARSVEEDEGSYSGSYEEDGSDQAGEEGSDSQYDNEGSYSGSYEEGSYSGSYEEEGEDEDGSCSGSFDERQDKERPHSVEDDDQVDASYTGSDEEEDAEGSHLQEEEENSYSGSYYEEGSQHEEVESEEGSQSGSYGEDASRSQESDQEEGSYAGSHEDEESEAYSRSQSAEEEDGTCTGSHDEEGDDDSQSHEDGEGSYTGSYDEESEADEVSRSQETDQEEESYSDSYEDEESEGTSHSDAAEEEEGSSSGSYEDEKDGEGSQSLVSEPREESSDPDSDDSEDEEESSESKEAEEEKNASTDSYEEEEEDEKEDSQSQIGEESHSEEGCDQSGEESDYSTGEETSASQDSDVSPSTEEGPKDEADDVDISCSEDSERNDVLKPEEIEQVDSAEENSYSERDESRSVESAEEESDAVTDFGSNDDESECVLEVKERETRKERNEIDLSYSDEEDLTNDQAPKESENLFQAAVEDELPSSSADPFTLPYVENNEFQVNAFADPAEKAFHPEGNTDFGVFPNDTIQGSDFPKATDDFEKVEGVREDPTEGENIEEESKGPSNSLFGTHSHSVDSYDVQVETFGTKAIPDIPSSSFNLGAKLTKNKKEMVEGDQKSLDSQISGSSSRLSVLNRRSGTKKNESRKGLNQTRAITAYTREQMTKLAQVPREKIVSNDDEEDASVPSSDAAGNRKKRKKNRRPVRVKSEALLELATSINNAMIELEKLEKEQPQKSAEDKAEKAGEEDKGEEGTSNQVTKQPANQVMYSFETLVGILLRLSDELELLSTFSKKSDAVAIEALKILLSYTDIIEDIFSQIKPILQEYLFQSVDDEMEDFLYGMNLIVEQLSEICYHVGEKHQWNARANTSYLTLLELLARDALEVSCIYDDVDTPDYLVTEDLQQAWEATGHDEEIKTLLVSDSDLAMFRQICYEVMLSCDQWCPDTDALMDICAIEESMVEQNKQGHHDDMVPPPEGALQVLEKINGEYLLRIPTMASILRRILPAEAVTDPRMKDSFARIRSTISNPLGLSPSTLVSISSIPEDPDDEDALGVAGVGKTTIAAMVANHQDVRRFFCDGIAWIYVGPTELNYTRYVQCLQDLIGQLELDEEDEPAFPELLHVPGESKAKRRRREEGFMIFVRQMMIDFFEGLNVLIILDDVCFDPDLDWFDFTPPPTVDPEDEEGSCVVLVTSRRRNLLPDADTVEVDMLEEKEAVKLLVKESQALSSILKPDSPEIKTVVIECANHALAVKSVGRWLNLKHASNGVATGTAEEIQQDVLKSVDRILKSASHGETDMMYELLNMSMSPAINSEPTSIIKFCFAAFVQVFCERQHISDFALADSTPIVPLAISEKLFEALLDLEERNLKKEKSLFHSENGEAASLIPQALAALGLFKVIVTFVDEDSQEEKAEEEEKFVQIMHKIQQEYGEYLWEEDPTLGDLTKDGERRWNKAFAQAFLAQACDWGTDNPDAGMDYALEMMPCHMYRGGMLKEAGNLLCNARFIKGRLFALGRENGTRRHIKDTEALFDLMKEQRAAGNKKMDPKRMMKNAYDTLSGLLYMEEDELIAEEGSPEAVEVGRSHFDIGLSLSERRCWEVALYHWEKSQELFVSSLGLVELVAGVLYNVGIVYAEMNDYEKSLSSLKQCLRIRGAIHGEEHILYAQTIQRIGDILLKMSDYQEAMESYNWALDVMHVEPNHHRIDIGDVLENMGSVHYSKGEVDEALRCFQDALRSKQVDLGEDHPELSSTFLRIGDCLADQGKTEEAIAHYEESIRLKNLDPDGGFERDADVLTIEGILHNLHGRQREGVESYEKALQVLVTKVPHRKEKVAALLHMIGCVYLMSGEHKRAMKLFEESLQARRKVLGFVHLDVASTLFNMAFLHQSRNRLDKALKCLEEALKIRQLRLPDTEKVAVTHEKIGNLSRALGKTKKAEIAFNEALRIRKIVHGDNHEAVATVLQELGDLMDDLGESDTAMKHYVLALEIRESRLGPDDLAVAETYYSMGFTLQNNDAVDRALQCFEESLSIRKFQLGDDAKEVGDTLNMMGFIQAQRGELEDAISLLWEALRIRKLHDDKVKVSETLKNIGNVHREKHEYELAIECYEECVRIRRRELGDVHEKLADALLAMGHAQSDMNLTDEAMESYREGKPEHFICHFIHFDSRDDEYLKRSCSSSLDHPNPTLWRTGRKCCSCTPIHGNFGVSRHQT